MTGHLKVPKVRSGLSKVELAALTAARCNCCIPEQTPELASAHSLQKHLLSTGLTFASTNCMTGSGSASSAAGRCPKVCRPTAAEPASKCCEVNESEPEMS